LLEEKSNNLLFNLNFCSLAIPLSVRHILSGPLVITERQVLRLQLGKTTNRYQKSSYEYTYYAVADKRQGVIPNLEGQTAAIDPNHNQRERYDYYAVPLAWMNPLCKGKAQNENV
jgi:hypothetical protein